MIGPVYFYLAQGLASSIKRAYTSGQKHFLLFCSQTVPVEPDPYPSLQGHPLCLCSTFSRLWPQSPVHLGLPSSRNLHTTSGVHHPELANLHRLHLVLKGITCHQTEVRGVQKRLLSPSPRLS